MNEEQLISIRELHKETKNLIDDLFNVYVTDPSAHNNFSYLDFLASHVSLLASLSHSPGYTMVSEDQLNQEVTENNVVELFKKE